MYRWLWEEAPYSDAKWTPEKEDAIHLEDFAGWVEQYMHRAIVLGLENPLGRQALAKGFMTYRSYLESVIRRCGPLPKGGVPSGEIRD